MLRTTFLMTALTLILVGLGDYFGGVNGMTFMLVISLAMNFYSYWNSDKLVLAQYNATQIEEKDAPEIYGIVRKLAERGGLPMPKVYVINSAVPNAFATGRNPEHAAVAITSGLANILTPEEIAGVLGHELSHVKHGDILIGSVAAAMAGVITTVARWGMFFGGGRRDDENRNPIVGLAIMLLAPVAAMLIQMAVSRSREYLADRSGGALCGNPDALADALLKIEGIASQRTLTNATPNTAHMFIICPFSTKDMKSLFSTHPTTEERVKLLRAEAEELRKKGHIDFE
ncbi:Protease HtpX [bioreactor metagenome]|jgi:Zn-dependent protease with chaperone function|uniref:Protease HtpX n=1 Tax=bioreactor metagenome TaxID=1076179 RepID=A0A644V3K5_9ZZZZ|nr:zinc metalloprotease HtpX [Acidaminococcaceae bacterium]